MLRRSGRSAVNLITVSGSQPIWRRCFVTYPTNSRPTTASLCPTLCDPDISPWTYISPDISPSDNSPGLFPLFTRRRSFPPFPLIDFKRHRWGGKLSEGKCPGNVLHSSPYACLSVCMSVCHTGSLSGI